MTKLALLYSGFSWASSVDLLHRLNWDLDLNLEIFTIASVSQGAGMLVLAIIGASFRVFSIWTGQDRPNPQQDNAAQHQDQQQLERKKRRWIRIFALTLIACWILLSGLQVDFFLNLNNIYEQVGWWSALPDHQYHPIYLVPVLLRDSTIILVLPLALILLFLRSKRSSLYCYAAQCNVMPPTFSFFHTKMSQHTLSQHSPSSQFLFGSLALLGSSVSLGSLDTLRSQVNKDHKFHSVR